MRQGDLPERASAPADDENREALSRLYNVLDRSNHEERMSFVLKNLEGMELSEVGATLGISVATVKRRLAKVHFVLPAGQNASPGNSLAIVQPDGHSLIEISGFARCIAGGPAYGFRYPDSDLYGDGRLGGQGGSGLSSLGGALVKGELTNGLPVRHALKVSLSAKKYYFENPALTEACFRWPADRCDAGHASSYGGMNPELAMGALLALPPTVRVDGLGLESVAGHAMFQTLQDYGAYVVGDAAVDRAIWGIEFSARTSFNERPGAERAAWERDVNRLLPLLQVVTNNGPTSVGGGGVPRKPLAPPIGN